MLGLFRSRPQVLSRVTGSLRSISGEVGGGGVGHPDPLNPGVWHSTEYVPTELPALEDRGAGDKQREYHLSCRTREEADCGQKKGYVSRDSGVIPGVIFGNCANGAGLGRDYVGNARVMVTTLHKDIQREVRANKSENGKNYWAVNGLESRVYNLTIEDDHEPAGLKAGDTIKVVPRHLQMHPIQNQVMCLNYLRYWPGRVLQIPLVPVNTELSNALKRGAFILKQNRFVSLTVAEGAKVPDSVEVDCEGLVLKQKIRLDRLILPEGCEWGTKVTKDFLVGSVYGRAKAMKD